MFLLKLKANCLLRHYLMSQAFLQTSNVSPKPEDVEIRSLELCYLFIFTLLQLVAACLENGVFGLIKELLQSLLIRMSPFQPLVFSVTLDHEFLIRESTNFSFYLT